MTKHILFPIVLVIIFIAVIGILGRNIQNKKLKPNLNSENNKKILTIKGKEINLEIADTYEKRRVGLSNRQGIDKNSGMLFVFNNKDIKAVFWMKDMQFPIDIIWINDNKIVQIDKNVPQPEKDAPESNLKRYSPKEPIDYVLEVNAGFCENNNIAVGDEVNLNQAL